MQQNEVSGFHAIDSDKFISMHRGSASICHFPNNICYSAVLSQKAVSIIIVLLQRSLAFWGVMLTVRIFTTSRGYREVLLHTSTF